MKRFVYIALMISAITLCSCDTPQTMAWNHYYYAQSLFEEGNLKRAQEYAEAAANDNDSSSNKRRSEELAAKIIKLQETIEQAMQANGSIQSNEENIQK